MSKISSNKTKRSRLQQGTNQQVTVESGKERARGSRRSGRPSGKGTHSRHDVNPPHSVWERLTSRASSENDSSESDYRPKPNSIIAVHRLKKSYRKANIEIPVLRGVSFEIETGEFISIVGQSGSGKSTLLHLLGTLDDPDSGEIHFGNRRIDTLKTRHRDRIRNSELGMIFQFYHLLPELTTLENVLVPRMIRDGAIAYWLKRREYHERARHLLDIVGLSHRASHRPRELSGGEMQRCAIARALIAQPRVLLADEPTGNLDSQNGTEIMKVLRRLNEVEQVTTLMVTHDLNIADQADRTITLVDGKVQRDS